MIEYPFNFDLERMKQAVEGGTIRIPQGLSREERREWIKSNLGKTEENKMNDEHDDL